MSRWAMAVASMALVAGGCGEASSGKAETEADASVGAGASPTVASSCADDGERLPLTGICAGRAVAYLNMDSSASPEAPDGCEWKVMETQFVEDVLLYRGLKCDAGETQLEFAGGAGRAELSLVSSAFLGKIDEPPVYVQVYVAEGTPLAAVTARARASIEDRAEAKGCFARKAGIDVWPSDALVVDIAPEKAAKLAADGPRTACGPLGLNEDEASYWRVMQGYAWFFQLGQDATEIDPGSFTLMTRQPDGSWGAM